MQSIALEWCKATPRERVACRLSQSRFGAENLEVLMNGRGTHPWHKQQMRWAYGWGIYQHALEGSRDRQEASSFTLQMQKLYPNWFQVKNGGRWTCHCFCKRSGSDRADWEEFPAQVVMPGDHPASWPSGEVAEVRRFGKRAPPILSDWGQLYLKNVLGRVGAVTWKPVAIPVWVSNKLAKMCAEQCRHGTLATGFWNLGADLIYGYLWHFMALRICGREAADKAAKVLQVLQ